MLYNWYQYQDSFFINSSTLNRGLKEAIRTFCHAPSHEESRSIFYNWTHPPEIENTNLGALHGVLDEAFDIIRRGDSQLKHTQINTEHVDKTYFLTAILHTIDQGNRIPGPLLYALPDAPSIVLQIGAYHAAKGGALKQAENEWLKKIGKPPSQGSQLSGDFVKECRNNLKTLVSAPLVDINEYNGARSDLSDAWELTNDRFPQSRCQQGFGLNTIRANMSRNARALAGIQHLSRALLPVAKMARDLRLNGETDLPLTGTRPRLKVVHVP